MKLIMPHGTCWGCRCKLDTAYVLPYCSDRCWRYDGSPDYISILKFKLYETFIRLEVYEVQSDFQE
jgi:hypothetical protein